MKRELASSSWLRLAGWRCWLPACPGSAASSWLSLALTCLMYVGAGVELGAVLRQHALPVAGDLGLLRHRRLHQRAGAGAAALARWSIALGAAIAARGRRGDRRGRAAPARHLLRGADLRHDRADPPCRDLLREAGHRHGGPRADGGAGPTRSTSPCWAGRAGRGARRSSCGAAASAWRWRGIGADEQRAQTLGVDTRAVKIAGFALTAAFAGAVGAAMAVRWTYIDPDSVFNPFIGFQTVLIALIGGAATLCGPGGRGRRCSACWPRRCACSCRTPT